MNIVNTGNSPIKIQDTSIMRVAAMQCKAFIFLGLLSLSSSIVLAADLSTYNSNNGLLTVQDYAGSDNKHYYLEFRNQGNSNFLLIGAKPLTARSSFQQLAYFNETANVVTIPSVNINQQYYAIDLRYTGGYSFTLARANKTQPPSNNQTVNPPQGSQSVKIIYNQAVAQLFRCHPAGALSHDCTDFWNTMAQLESMCKNNNQEACSRFNEVLGYNTALGGIVSVR